MFVGYDMFVDINSVKALKQEYWLQTLILKRVAIAIPLSVTIEIKLLESLPRFNCN